MEENKSPITSHLEELRKRLIRVSISVFICFAISYLFKEKLFLILSKPLLSITGKENIMIFTALPEAFFSYLKVAFLSGIMLASPFILFELWSFISPGLYKKEKIFFVIIIIFSTIFFVGGALFAYFFVFPLGFKFFLGFEAGAIKALPSMKEYLSFTMKLLIAFGLVFELPLFIVFLTRLGLVSIQTLKKGRKYAIVLIFIAGAILTPPDIISQILMAVPLILLFEISIIAASIFEKKK